MKLKNNKYWNWCVYWILGGELATWRKAKSYIMFAKDAHKDSLELHRPCLQSRLSKTQFLRLHQPCKMASLPCPCLLWIPQKIFLWPHLPQHPTPQNFPSVNILGEQTSQNRPTHSQNLERKQKKQGSKHPPTKTNSEISI